MKIKLVALLLVFFIAAAAISFDSFHRSVSVTGDEVEPANFPAAQALTFTTLDGRTLTLTALPERGIVLHFWASWCSPCAAEFPALLRQVAGSDGKLALVAVSLDDNRAAMERFIARLPAVARGDHIYWVQDSDKKLSLEYFDTVRVPESVLIDGRRHMVDKIAGDPGWESRVMADKISALTAR